MNKTIVITGASLGLFGVILGAFGAHGLESRLSGEYMDAYNTGVNYQMLHALLLVLIGSMDKLGVRSKIRVFRLLLAGIICFSCSLYVLAIASITGHNLGIFGIVTPIGGLLLISGWFVLAYRIYRPLD